MTPEVVSPLERQRLETAKILLETPDCVLLDFNKGFIFSSGIQSPIKVDCEKLADSPEHFEKIVCQLEGVIRRTFGDYRFLCGVIKGGTLFAQVLAKRLRVNPVARLGVKRDSERETMVSGVIDQNAKGVIIEDVLTTGVNIALSAKQIEDEGGFHLGEVVIFDYGFQKAKDNLWKHHLRSWTLTTFDQLLKEGFELGRFDLDTVVALKAWWEKTNHYLSAETQTAII